jgi:hypothetical protein
VHEVAPRLPFLDALAAQVHASALVCLGSSEPHYTASRVFPTLLAARPLLAVYHAASSVVEIVRRAAPAARIVTYDDARRAATCSDEIERHLTALLEAPDALFSIDASALAEHSAPQLAGRLAAVLDGVRR